MADFKDILFRKEEQLSDDELLQYLNDHLSEEEKQYVEKKIAEGSFETDALEGLSQIENKKNIQKQLTQLNKQLHQQLIAKKHNKEKRKINILGWVILTILLLLFICVFGYLIITMQNKSNAHSDIHFITKELLSII